MLKYNTVQKYHKRILNACLKRDIKLNSIKYVPDERDCFNHAVQDLIISGMIQYVQLNPEIIIKRIA